MQFSDNSDDAGMSHRLGPKYMLGADVYFILLEIDYRYLLHSWKNEADIWM